MQPSKEAMLRRIPSVEVLLQEAARQPWTAGVPRRLLVDAMRRAVDETRRSLADRPEDATDQQIRETILGLASQHVREDWRPHYRRAVNATGILLHTNLGRAVLPAKAMCQLGEHLAGYSVLQMDVETGKRSRRDARLEWMLQQLTGAEAATVVNNNAAATMIVLNTIAQGKEVIVSRGQLVEIGGSFRLPEVMAASGAKLVEVGTTNKTHARDYENAITENTAAILRVHPSNYKIYGFTAEVGLDDLVRIARARGIVLIDDVGAGALVDLSRFGFTDQPMLQESIRAGADLVTSSTDKLIGGSQGGLILGKAPLVERIRKSPLARILRVGKLTLAALEATLSLFFDEETVLREVPTLRMLTRDLPDITAQAERIARAIGSRTAAATITTLEGVSEMGSGSLPTQNIPTRLVAIAPKSMTPDDLAVALRRHEPPVFARIQNDQVLADPRTLLEGDEEILIAAVVAALG